jgi:hypothetical protein
LNNENGGSAVTVGQGVQVTVGVEVGVGEKVAVGVDDGVAVAVAVSVGVGVKRAVGVSVGRAATAAAWTCPCCAGGASGVGVRVGGSSTAGARSSGYSAMASIKIKLSPVVVGWSVKKKTVTVALTALAFTSMFTSGGG